jgi:UDP-sulfoquinovose synthase
VELACLNPADRGEFRVFNQFTEQFTINQLAELVQRAGKECGIDVAINPVANPRVEKEGHYYNAKHTKLLGLGLEPHLLSETLVEHMFGVIGANRDRVAVEHIMPKTTWRGSRAIRAGEVPPRPARPVDELVRD